MADILVEHSEEVVEMFLTDYDFEEHRKLERKEKLNFWHRIARRAESIDEFLEKQGCGSRPQIADERGA